MKTNKLMIAVALAASCAVSVAHAERNRDREHGRDHQRRDFTTDVTRTVIVGAPTPEMRMSCRKAVRSSSVANP